MIVSFAVMNLHMYILQKKVHMTSFKIYKTISL